MKNKKLFYLITLYIALAMLNGAPQATGRPEFIHKAVYFTRLAKQKVKCTLCPFACVLNKGQTGICLVRTNIKGSLYNVNFGNVSLYYAKALDYSKFPLTLLWHSRLDIRGFSGCALKCSFCHAGETIAKKPEELSDAYKNSYYSPEAIIDLAKKDKIGIITFTDNEPVINYEFTLAVAKLAKQNHVMVGLNTAGFINSKPFIELLPYVDFVFYSFKGFSEEAYKRYTTGDLNTALTNLKLLKKYNIKTEILYVVIPTISDSPRDIKAMAAWVKNNLGEYTPVHFMRYKPAFKLKNLPQTPLSTIKKAIMLAQEQGLKNAMPFATFGPCNLQELVAEGLLELKCPFCGKIAAQVVLDKDSTTRLVQNFGENHTCKYCGKEFLNLFMK